MFWIIQNTQNHICVFSAYNSIRYVDNDIKYLKETNSRSHTIHDIINRRPPFVRDFQQEIVFHVYLFLLWTILSLTLCFLTFSIFLFFSVFVSVPFHFLFVFRWKITFHPDWIAFTILLILKWNTQRHSDYLSVCHVIWKNVWSHSVVRMVRQKISKVQSSMKANGISLRKTQSFYVYNSNEPNIISKAISGSTNRFFHEYDKKWINFPMFIEESNIFGIYYFKSG